MEAKAVVEMMDTAKVIGKFPFNAFWVLFQLSRRPFWRIYDSLTNIGHFFRARIIRNQWSDYWGYSGYIYVAMGENTCGVLNDMTQVYM